MKKYKRKCCIFVPVLILCFVGAGGVMSQCPKECSCAGHSLDCANMGLTYVPRDVPRNAERLDLQGNNITYIHKNDFQGLKNLRILQLLDNQISGIERGAFDDLVSIERLRLNNNRLQSMPDLLFLNMPRLYRLDLSHNMLQIISKKTLRGAPLLKNLQLDNNDVQCIDEASLKNLKEMEILTLNNNNITTLAKDMFANMPKLRTMRLAENKLQCDCHLAWLAKWLRSKPRLALFTKCASPADLQNVEVAGLKESDFKCNGVEKFLPMDCSMKMSCPQTCICTEGIVDCRGRGLKYIPLNIPESTTELRLEQNSITRVPSKAFLDFKRLRRIDLSNNQISDMASDAFYGLKNLNSLVLYGNKIADLPSKVFSGLTSLQLLLLNANKISCIREDAFSDLHGLNLLSLYDNNIQSLANGTFAPLKSIQTLHLARNPFICDCNLRWLSEYLHSNPIETSGARCESPKRMQRKRIGQMKDSKFKCKGSEEYRTKKAGECVIDKDCPVQCTCTGTVVDCSKRRLTEIPGQIPTFTTDLRLNDNIIKEVINNSLFEKLHSLRKLDLRNNLIENIEPNAFVGADSLTDLLLTENKLKELRPDMWTGLERLRTLSLYDNQIRCVQDDTFKNLEFLATLNLLSNPFNCNCRLRWFPEWLRAQNIISGNPKCESPPKLQGSAMLDIPLREFTCDDGIEHTCEPLLPCPAGCMCQGTIVRCSQARLRSVPDDIRIDTTELYLDDNEIKSIPKHLGLLKNLHRLDLSKNSISSIPDNIFSNLTKLQTLIMSFNKLQCINLHSFSGLYSLRILSLHGNDLSMIPEGSFKDLTSLSHIALGGNPLYCDCNLSWLSDLVKKYFLEPGIATCGGPNRMKNRLLLSTPNRDFICAGDPNATILAKCDICWTFPCKNNATCYTKTNNEYECECAIGYHGDHCDLIIDACYGNPCDNAGTCKVLQEGRFSCLCPSGFEGDRCETNIDDCIGNNCKNNATCQDLINDYACICPSGYTGELCNEKIDFCSENYNPCENGATCVNMDTDYLCVCASGFNGANCSENIDDCVDHSCQNGATCMDGINAYTCMCPDGYSGTYCEIAPVMSLMYYMSSPCEKHICQNGVCYKPENANDYLCKCNPGFVGRTCDALQSVTFKGRNSHAEFSRVQLKPSFAVSLTFATEEQNGILLYTGDQEHIAAELFRGRVRISYDVGNYPVSTMFSYEKVSDGLYHTVEMVSSGRNFTMKIDNKQARTIINDGDREYAEMESPLYIAGLPEHMQKQALSRWHIRNGTSFHGCIKHMLVNEIEQDFLRVQNQHLMAPGCPVYDNPNPCEDHLCKNGGVCIETENHSYMCDCKAGYGGQFCEKERVRKSKASVSSRKPSCHKESTKDFIIENGCKSIKTVKTSECTGSCGAAGCCRPIKVKARKVRMICSDKRRYTKHFKVIRKCGCQNC